MLNVLLTNISCLLTQKWGHICAVLKVVVRHIRRAAIQDSMYLNIRRFRNTGALIRSVAPKGIFALIRNFSGILIEHTDQNKRHRSVQSAIEYLRIQQCYVPILIMSTLYIPSSGGFERLKNFSGVICWAQKNTIYPARFGEELL